MNTLIVYIIISFTNVFLHITRSIFVIKSGKFIASLMNCICYTFSAIVIKFIAETDIYTAITVQAKQTVDGWQTENGGQIEYMNGETSATYYYDPVMSGGSYSVGIEVDGDGNVTPVIE